MGLLATRSGGLILAAFLARLFYFGTGFHGSQYQPGLRTVQGELISAITRWSGESHDTTTVRLSGRTDRGVHSVGQVVMINTESPLSVSGINKYLPPDISLWASRRVCSDFNPRRDVLGRYYRYYLPLDNNFDLLVMKQAAQLLIGSHDFRFLSKRDGVRPTRTTILNISLKKIDKSLMIEVFGTSFLWKLVRNIVSLLALVGLHEITLTDISKIVNVQCRLKSGIKPAPPESLFLMESLVPFRFNPDKYGVRRTRKAIRGLMGYLERSLIALSGLSSEIEETLSPA